MANPEELLVTAEAAYKADKKNKDLKKAFKTAKKAAAAWKEEQAAKAVAKEAKKAKKESKKKRKASESEAEAPAKKAKKEEAPKVTLESVQAAAKAAKAAHKASPEDAALKAAYKEARKAAKNFTPEAAAAAPVAAAEEEDVPLKKANAVEEDVPLKKAGGAASGGAAPANANEKLFLGNLSWDIDDDSIREFFKECGELIDIFWLEDKETGRFKGCGFVTFSTLDGAIAGQAKAGEEVMGREIKIDFANPRPGGDRPKKAGAGGGANKGLSARPDNCTTVFAGNLSYDIDDDKMREFAAESGEIKAIRWLTDRDSGDFKGCGFIEFYDAESVDKFILKNGEDVLGRNIRLDYSAPRAPREDKSW